MANKRRTTAANEYRSSCPVCRQGIFAADETVWIRKPVLGTVHLACKPAESDSEETDHA